MRWIKASERVPDFTHAHLVHLRFSTNETKFSLTGYYKDGLWYRQYGEDNLLDWAPNLEWLDESLPASAEEEAARMYPKEIVVTKEHSEKFTFNQIAEMQRSAHITCAGMYTGEIERLKAEVERLKAFEVKANELLDDFRMAVMDQDWIKAIDDVQGIK